MAFIWSDKRYWKNYKRSVKIEFKILVPLIIISGILWYVFFHEKLSNFELFFLAFFSGMSVFSFMSIFKEFPNTAIGEKQTKFERRIIYIFQFLVISILSTLTILKIFNI